MKITRKPKRPAARAGGAARAVGTPAAGRVAAPAPRVSCPPHAAGSPRPRAPRPPREAR